MKILLLCLVIHFIADFLMQSREMGQKKSSELSWLFRHLWIQTYMFGLGLTLIVGPFVAFKFAIINSLVHGLIDWNIWRAYKLYAHHRIIKLAKSDLDRDVRHTGDKNYEDARVQRFIKEFKYWEDHWFYSTIGFDQLLHVSTLVILAGVLL